MARQITTVSHTIENNRVFKEGNVDFERAIELCGYGRYHYGFVFLCGMMFLCVGCQNGISAYILPSAECDLRLSSEQKGLLNVSFLVGGVISSLFWGVLADAYGRRNILLITMMCDSILSLVSSFSPTFKVLLVFRVINGFTIGAPGSLVYTYLGEFHSEKQRAQSICYIGFFWTLSWLILPGLAWSILPLPIAVEFDGLLYNSWRLFLAVIGLPTFVVAMVTTRYPESPKFLVSRGKLEEALAILREIYAINTGQDEEDYPVKSLLADDQGSGSKDDSSSGVLLKLMRNIWQQIKLLTSPRLFKYALLCWIIYASNMFGYYGFGLWLPELFHRFENYHRIHPNSSVTVCELMTVTEHLNKTHVTHNVVAPLNNLEEMTTCNYAMDHRVFVNALIINAVCLVGNIASGYFANRVGRRTMPVGTMLVAGIFGFAIYFVRSSLQILLMTCAFSVAIATGNFVIGSVVVDIFPTNVGAVAICMMTCLGRLGAIASNLAFGMLLDISCEIPIILVASVVVLGGLLGLLLPIKER